MSRHGQAFDYVQMGDTREGVDFWDLLDQTFGVTTYHGRMRSEMDSLLLNAASFTFDFVHGDGFVQNFDLSTELESTVHGSGQIGFTRRWLDDPAKVVEGTIGFALKRLRVKPGHCSV